jgi:hypothetical protein
MRLAWLVVAGCGRVSFDPVADPLLSSDAQRASDASSSFGDATFPAGLVAYFPLDDPDPDDAVDVGMGTCATTCPALITGFRGNALQFDGSNDCIVVADYAALHQATPTIALRVFTTMAGQDAGIFAKRVDINSNPVDTWQFTAGPTDALEVGLTHGTSSNQVVASPDATLATGRWQHLAFTYDGTNVRVFIDGTQRNTSVQVGALTYDGNNATIGCDDNGGPVRFYRGAIDELQIYDRPLSAAEIMTLAM